MPAKQGNNKQNDETYSTRPLKEQLKQGMLETVNGGFRVLNGSPARGVVLPALKPMLSKQGEEPEATG